MRWGIKNNHLETREIEKFAWLPIICKRWDKREIRWMERVKIRQTWYAFGDDLRITLFGGYWENNWFID
jgi:hypothetical protein